MVVREIQDGIAPQIATQLGFTYDRRTRESVRTSPTGVLLRADDDYFLPLPLDRLLLFFLAAVAVTQTAALVPFREIINWVGVREKHH